MSEGPAFVEGGAAGAGPASPLHLFAAFGIELEYMLVDAGSLDVLPVADEVLRAAAGEIVGDWENGEIAWSNELVLHLLELKTNGPAPALAGLPALFQRDLGRLRELLAPLGGRVMPTAMHPWMDPAVETRLWPHAGGEVYAAFDRIFGCKGHGWSNLQSVHLNLPFAGDEEFSCLHAAIRMVLPILPALAASSPVVDGHATGVLDNRLEFYRRNCARIPSLTAAVIPEPVFSRAAYERDILAPIYRDLAPHDPEGVLRDEWVNARGAIARFQRDAVEIRVLDMQECPRADLASAALIVAAIRALVEARWADRERQLRWSTARLARILRAVVRDGERARLHDPEYVEMFGLHGDRQRTAGELWQHLAQELMFGPDMDRGWRRPLEVILERGPLGRRILAALGPDPGRDRLAGVYRQLCDCLDAGVLFE